MNQFDVHVIRTSDVDQTKEKELMTVFCTTFTSQKLEKYFQWKFRDNPFGESIHVLVYDEGNLISTRVFWRMDIEGQESYQCVDTAVIPAYQGRGIFTLSTKAALERIGDKPIYNHPNKQSRPAYLKNGWTIDSQQKIKVSPTRLALTHAPEINWSQSHLKWRFEQNPVSTYASMRVEDKNYIFGYRRGRWAVLLGSTDKHIELPNISPKFCFSYDPDAWGIGLPNKQTWLRRGALPGALYSYLFDMM